MVIETPSEETLKIFIASPREQNETFKNILKNHDNSLGQLIGKIAGLTNNVQALDGRTKRHGGTSF